MSESRKSQESESGIESGSGGSCRAESEKTPSKVETENVDTTNDPRCWPNASKLRATACIGALSFLEPFASSMVAPSLEIIAEEFNITSSVERNVSADILRNGIHGHTADESTYSSYFPPLFYPMPWVHYYWHRPRSWWVVGRWCCGLRSYSWLSLWQAELRKVAPSSSYSESYQAWVHALHQLWEQH
jgi:hypothetical protein